MQYLDNKTIEHIRRGFYSAVYFNRTQQILLKEKLLTRVTMQIFQKQHALVCGVNQVVELLKSATGYLETDKWIDKWDEIEVKAMPDGSLIKPWETVIHITGPYAYFAHLESVYLGILARSTKIATNTKKVVDAANEKQVIFFADRFDYFLNQELDGYAAHIGGVSGVCTQAHGLLWGGTPVGTIPHALIAANNGNAIKAAEQFAKYYPTAPLIILVDFNNDCVAASIELAKRFGKKLWGVRLDTSETMIDRSLQNTQNDRDNKVSNELYGVSSALVRNVRQGLNQHGFSHVKIVVSGGFTAEKIAAFEKDKIPVDIYGIGSALMKENIDFTADIVQVGVKEIAKEGRKLRNNERMILMR